MGMRMILLSSNEHELSRYQSDPNALSELILHLTIEKAGLEGDALNQLFDEVKPKGLLAKTGWFFFKLYLKRRVKRASKAVPTEAIAPKEPPTAHFCDLEKSWHVLHFLFTGSAWEGSAPANTLLSGSEFGEDMGYGPPRFVDPLQTAAFAQFLSSMSVDTLRAKIDSATLRNANLYGVHLDEDDGEAEGCLDDVNEEVEHYLPLLQDFVGKAASSKSGIIIALS